MNDMHDPPISLQTIQEFYRSAKRPKEDLSRDIKQHILHGHNGNADERELTGPSFFFIDEPK